MTSAFSTTRLERLRDVLTGYIERDELPGLVSLVSRGDEVHVEALGKKARDDAQPMRRDTIFRISSMTKPLTAAAALCLVEDCRLRLDDPVDPWLPELANRRVLARIDGPVEETVPARRAITLRDLLGMQLGYGLVMAPPDALPILRAAGAVGFIQGPPAPARRPAPDEHLRRFAKLPLMYQPGERWIYHTSFELLSVLIARASGKSLEQLLQERIFEPLEMKDTSFSVPASKLPRFVPSYAMDRETRKQQVLDPAVGGQWSTPPAFESGADGLVSTIDDYHAFARMLLQQGKFGKHRVLSRFSVELMTTDHLTAEQRVASDLLGADRESFGYGFGVSVITKRKNLWESVGQYGWDGGLGTVWRSDRTHDVTTILLTQQAWPSPKPPPICLDFWTSAYQALDV